MTARRSPTRELEGLPDQAPPHEGSVFDSRPFWSGGGRRASTSDSGGKSSRWRKSDPSRPRRGTTRRNSEAAERRTTSARRHFLPMPQETIGRHLGAGEVVLLSDSPAFKWFVASNLLWFFGLAALIAGIFICLLEGWGWAALAVLPRRVGRRRHPVHACGSPSGTPATSSPMPA